MRHFRGGADTVVPVGSRAGLATYPYPLYLAALACIAAIALGSGEADAMLLGGLVVFGIPLAAICYQVRLPIFQSRASR